jgi:hypothetical protein
MHVCGNPRSFLFLSPAVFANSIFVSPSYNLSTILFNNHAVDITNITMATLKKDVCQKLCQLIFPAF